MSSPAEILREYLIQQQVCSMPGEINQLVPFDPHRGDGSTLCYVGSMPDEVDQLVLLRDTSGSMFGRMLRTGKTQLHSGIKITVRALYYGLGYHLANLIATTIDNLPAPGTIYIDEWSESGPISTPHYVGSIYRTSPIMALGEESSKKREVFSLNVQMSLQDFEPSLG